MEGTTTSPPDVVRIRGDSTQSFIMNVGKKVLKEHGTVEYHGVGQACAIGIIAAERL
jgi:hypothetical protein